MRSSVSLGVLGFVVAVSAADAATITGTVTGPDGAPFRGAFVQARNAKMKMTVSVLTDKAGRYTITFPGDEGDYMVNVAALSSER